MVDRRETDGWTLEHGYTVSISSPCEPAGPGELIKEGKIKTLTFLH